MNIHYLQHVPYEGVGYIGDWADSRGHELSASLLFSGEPDAASLPSLQEVGLLVVMGGPMNVYEHDEHPWLGAEKSFIGSCIAEGRAVLGVCLGAQLIADVLGAEVTRAPLEEIGWHPVEVTKTGRQLEVFAHFPDRFTTLQWHGDTFSIPRGATHVARSEAVANQAFAYDGGRVVGLQFHLEETPESLAELVDAAGGTLAATRSAGTARGAWVSSREELLDPRAPYEACRELLFGLLDRMVMR